MMKILVSCIALIAGASAACADAPKCPQIRIIVPFSAGGASDITGRLVANPLGEALHKTVIVENKPGATGNIATAYVAKSPADGCTLVVNVAAIRSYQWVFNDLGYDPVKDLVAIGGIGKSPSLVLTSASSELKNLNELVALSKTKPDGITFATAGLGLAPHLAVVELARFSGAKFVPVFYRGAPDFMGDLMSGRVLFGSTAAANSLALVRQGKLKALAVLQKDRSAMAPDIPSSAEQGLSSMDGSSHFMLFAPSATPKATVETLSTELKKIVSRPEIQAKLAAIGFDPSPIGTEEATKVVIDLGQQLEPLVKALNLRDKH